MVCFSTPHSQSADCWKSWYWRFYEHVRQFFDLNATDLTLQKDYYLLRGADRFHPHEAYDSDECKAILINHPGFHYLEDGWCTLLGIQMLQSLSVFL